jgi:hypothetical protein
MKHSQLNISIKCVMEGDRRVKSRQDGDRLSTQGSCRDLDLKRMERCRNSCRNGSELKMLRGKKDP